MAAFVRGFDIVELCDDVECSGESIGELVRLEIEKQFL